MQRHEKLVQLLGMLKDNGGKATFDFLYRKFVEEFGGVTKKTFWSYLEDLKSLASIDYSEIHMIGQEGMIEIKLTAKI